jgi:hypothetical protein
MQLIFLIPLRKMEGIMLPEKLFLASFALWCVLSGSFTMANAATITQRQSDEITFIFIEGALEYGDHEQFVQAALPAKRGVVILSSPGGNLNAGLEIGKAIRLKGFSTYVPGGFSCSSACALAWLGGIKRFADSQSEIGFHAAYTMDGTKAKESGMANALVGAYLNQLGLSEDAITFITAASPDNMQWLKEEQANAIGIPVVMLSANETAIVTGAQTDPLSGQQRLAESEVSDLVESYHDQWSAGGDVNYDYVQNYYAEQVTFYGRPVNLSDIYDEKLKFSKRWPLRDYRIKPSTIDIDCFSDTDCHASYVVEFDARSPARNKSASGLSRGFISLHRFPEGWRITQETSEVIARK